MYYTMICAIARDENEYLKEWVSYHFSIGFEHIVIYDNLSKIPIAETLKEYVSQKLVTVINYPITEAQQLSSYFHCIKNFKSKAAWIGFIDIDEFIVPRQLSDIRDVLDMYRDYAGLGISWCVFGSNGHIRKPCGYVIENFTKFLEISPIIKSIVQAKYVLYPKSPHHFAFSENFCVNEDYICINGHSSYPVANKIQINHYYYKSQQEFEEKISRGLGTRMKDNAVRDISIFYRHLDKNAEDELSISKHFPAFYEFIKMSPLEIARLRTCPESDDIKELYANFLKLILENKIKLARDIYKKISRYFDSVFVYLCGAMLDMRGKHFDAALKKIGLGLHKYPGDPMLYSVLSSLYRLSNKNTVAQSIDKEFEAIRSNSK